MRKKIDDVFGHTLSNNDKRSLATLIYYPKEKMDLVKDTEEDMENWYKITLYRLIEICKTTASKYTRSKVRTALPADYAGAQPDPRPCEVSSALARAHLGLPAFLGVSNRRVNQRGGSAVCHGGLDA